MRSPVLKLAGWMASGIVLLAACRETAQPDTTGGQDAQADAERGDSSLALDRGLDRGAERGADRGQTCPPGRRVGKAGATDGLTSSSGTPFSVRTPMSYTPTVAHPLIVMYSRGGVAAATMEVEADLTKPATDAGFVIAYVDDVSPAATTLVDAAGAIPAQIAESYCIDESRVYLTGHSNGGTIIYVMMARGSWRPAPAAIAPSAAGVSAASLAQFPCPKTPVTVMVLHSSKDSLFPGFGAEAVDYWKQCQKCAGGPAPDPSTAANCTRYSQCDGGVEVEYCEGNGKHGTWPKGINGQLLAFFDRHRRVQ